MTSTATSLKEDWMGMPEECFKPLTFGELGIGHKFIGLPCPGDNSGHGGLRGTHYLFLKTAQKVSEESPDLEYAIPHGSAVNISRDVSSDYPDSMLVILVE